MSGAGREPMDIDAWAHERALHGVMRATGLNEVGAAFMLGRSDGDAASAIAEFWAMEATDDE
jgi:hypothetical protein